MNYPYVRIRLLVQSCVSPITLIAPDLIYAEVGNIIWKIQRFQGLNNQDAEITLDLLY